MDLPAALLAPAWHWGALLLCLPVLYRLAWAAPWQRLAAVTGMNQLLGCAVVLMVLWSMQAGIHPGLNLHLLGAMAATLALGPELAMVAMGLTLAGVALNGGIDWTSWPINFLVMVVAPVLIAQAWRRFVERWLPAHFFIFIFVVAFLGSALVVGAQGLIAATLLAAAGAYPWVFLAGEHLPYLMLLGFAEAWMGGAAITVLVVYKPEWVAAFDDRRYLLNK